MGPVDPAVGGYAGVEVSRCPVPEQLVDNQLVTVCASSSNTGSWSRARTTSTSAVSQAGQACPARSRSALCRYRDYADVGGVVADQGP